MPRHRLSLQDWWTRFFDRFAHSYLVWAMAAVILGLGAANIREVVGDYAQREAQMLSGRQSLLLERKREELEDVFRALYESARTIALIPAIRAVEGGNRRNALDRVERQGRLSTDIHQTVQQIYRNLYRNIRVSEIYYVLDGFRPDLGEVPFFMYDELISVEGAPLVGPAGDHDLAAEEAEYAYYRRQLDWFRSQYPQWNFDDNIDGIPAALSPLLQTCDLSQVKSAAQPDPRDATGLLYSVPVYGARDGGFKGLISAVLRANVLEALIIGVPHLIVTEADADNARRLGFALPESPASFVLRHTGYGIEIFDRRNALLAEGFDGVRRRADGGRWAEVALDGRGDGAFTLHHYLSPAAIDGLAAPLRHERNRAVAARLALLCGLMLAFWRAIRDQRHHHAELVRLAHYDSLTELPNRRLFMQRLEQSLARARRHRGRLGLMFLDVDNFGSINDAIGHESGDALLVAVAARLKESLRCGDEVGLSSAVRDQGTTLARLSGDDFTLIFEDLARADDVAVVAERLLERFREPLVLAGEAVEVTLSAGVAVFPEDAADSNDLMVCAEQAQRHASAAGTRQYYVFNDEMRRRAERRNALVRELPQAVRARQFNLAYQPKLALAGDRVASFEALLRWHSPVLGQVSPAEFVPLLERSGQIVEVGRWILDTACRQLREWQRLGHPELRISVNVSARQLLLSDVVAVVAEVLAESNVEPWALTLEITESMVIDNLQDGRNLLERLRGLGVRLAIDDFGTGYSSLTYLQSLPVDCLKLDKSMIDTVLEARGAHVVRSTIALAHGLGLEVVAEGVEHQAQLEALAAMGCDMVQGFHLSRPLDASAAGRFLAGNDAPSVRVGQVR
ncbi:MAG: bifunctional diguanylate cyclase/phosphodiesterase [Rhodocyclaceae bacterium]|nr:bifunctional diguanylate cyclase/phosphodiesterase [Rhodocyclaceae bacterium]